MKSPNTLSTAEKTKLDRAQKLYGEKKWNEALNILNEIENINIHAMQLKMHCMVELRNFSDAVDVCLAAHAFDPKLEWPLYWGCLSAVYCSRNYELIGLGAEFVAKNEERTQSYFWCWLSNAYLCVNLPDFSLLCTMRALDKDAGDPNLLLLGFRASVACRNLEKAECFLTKIEKRLPGRTSDPIALKKDDLKWLASLTNLSGALKLQVGLGCFQNNWHDLCERTLLEASKEFARQGLSDLFDVAAEFGCLSISEQINDINQDSRADRFQQFLDLEDFGSRNARWPLIYKGAKSPSGII
jgi:hypothetical protein